MEQKDQNEALRLTGVLEEFSSGYRKLMTFGQRLILPKNTIVAKPGEACSHCYILKEGQVIAFEYTETGAEHDFIIHDSPNMFLESQILMDRPVPVYFKATKQSEVVALERSALLEAMQSDFEITLLIARLLGEKFNYAMVQLRNKSAYGSIWQLCDLLLDMAERYGAPYDGKVMIMEKISQQMMANLLRINRITVVKNLTELKAAGLVEQVNGQYCIRDAEALRRYRDRKIL